MSDNPRRPQLYAAHAADFRDVTERPPGQRASAGPRGGWVGAGSLISMVLGSGVVSAAAAATVVTFAAITGSAGWAATAGLIAAALASWVVVFLLRIRQRRRLGVRDERRADIHARLISCHGPDSPRPPARKMLTRTLSRSALRISLGSNSQKQ